VRFVLRFSLYLVCFGLLAALGITAPLTRAITTVVVHTSHSLVTLVDGSVQLAAGTIRGGTTAVRVSSECSGVDLMAFLLAAVLAFPASIQARLAGGAAMIIAIICTNTLRVASLFAIARYQPDLFDVAHHYLWQAILVVLAVGGWSWWAVTVGRSG